MYVSSSTLVLKKTDDGNTEILSAPKFITLDYNDMFGKATEIVLTVRGVNGEASYILKSAFSSDDRLSGKLIHSSIDGIEIHNSGG